MSTESVYVATPIEADWWYEAGSPRGYKIPAALWAEYMALKERAEAIEDQMTACPYVDDRVLTPEQIEREREAWETMMRLIPTDTPFFNKIARVRY